MYLDLYENSNFKRGASRIKEVFWLLSGDMFLAGSLPGSFWRVGLLRLFGAKIGVGVVIKPKLRVKFPWRLNIGNYCWLGESVWIDNLAEVNLGDHICISQGAYFCTGSHDWGKQSFDLIVKPINVASHSWIGAMSRVGPGVTIGEGTVLTFGSVATRALAPWSICSGNPAIEIKKRSMVKR
ncbi:WcaF family extracellular polysaccharide biosynthesis acetyltransferase [Methylovulum psychrotolerans]|uniref:Putative colanic acid biosynthesis acetyltransferase n=1 Tax=Methylovulum psychrotolerans TaxID=1704499 RepID=A0A2S5CMR1_9GAMM|nr:WcaF family extracellular polysaccharide biosynthesis acetyltransferase [Methylovulum psychrotolerans]POZ52110.1 putative colanic acid biosynthesis acetyltransferase [Methylovulum psychrotolerans]